MPPYPSLYAFGGLVEKMILTNFWLEAVKVCMPPLMVLLMKRWLVALKCFWVWWVGRWARPILPFIYICMYRAIHSIGNDSTCWSLSPGHWFPRSLCFHTFFCCGKMINRPSCRCFHEVPAGSEQPKCIEMYGALWLNSLLWENCQFIYVYRWFTSEKWCFSSSQTVIISQRVQWVLVHGTYWLVQIQGSGSNKPIIPWPSNGQS